MRNKKISTFEELVHVLTESEYHEDGHLHMATAKGVMHQWCTHKYLQEILYSGDGTSTYLTS